MTMHCLVTGATGFVGSNLVRSLLSEGHDVRATGAPGSTTRYLDDLPVEVRLADLLDHESRADLVAGIDWVFHVAGDTSTWSRLAARRRMVNIDAAAGLADAAVRAGVRRFVHTSTMDVHGYNRDGSPLSERSGEESLTGIGYDYAETKIAGEAAVLSRIEDGLEVVVVYPGFMIGPFDHTLQLGRIIRDFQAGKTVFAFPGTSSFCDVRQVADGMVAAAERGRTGEGYNLTGHNRSYREVFTQIGSLVGSTKRPVAISRSALSVYGRLSQLMSRLTNRVPDMDPALAKYLSVPQASDWAKARRELGYEPGDVATAVRDAASWYDTYMPL